MFNIPFVCWRYPMRYSRAALLVLFLLSSPVFAGEVATTVTIIARVVPNCRVDVQPMDFGAYDPLQSHAAAPLQAQSELSLLCTRNIPASIELDAGFYGSTARARALGLGGIRLGYSLFSDAARNRVWGLGADAVVLTGTEDRPAGSPLRLTVYGAIPPGQEVQAGDYTDIVTARVSF